MLGVVLGLAIGLAIALLGWLAVALLHGALAWGVIASLLAPVPLLSVLAWRWWRSRSPRRADPDLAAVDRAWADILASAGDAAEPPRPWWLLLGGSGSGKTTLLAESGVAWAARPPEGEAGRAPRLWRSDAGCVLELPGTWADGRNCPAGWRRLLQLLRSRRGRHAVQGVVACVGCGDLLRRGPLATAVTAQAIRDRGEELAAALGCAPPLTLVLTKADQIGGCKDFYANATRDERFQELAAVLPWPPAADQAAAWREAHARLVDAVRDRRMAALVRTRDDGAACKAFQFPLQLAAAGAPLAELIGHLVQPGGRETLPLRAVNLSSGLRPPAPAGAVAARPAERTDLNASVYAGARPRIGAEAGGCGLFARDLFARALPESAAQAAPTRSAGRAARRWRALCLVAAPVAAALVCVWLLSGSVRRAIATDALRASAAEALAVERAHPDDGPRNLDALDRLGADLAGLAACDGPEAALRSAGSVHARLLGRLLLDQAAAGLAKRIAELRARPEADADRLLSALRAYQMLAGAVPADPAVVEEVLAADRLWYATLEKGGARLDWPTEVLARRQLERHARELLPRGLDRIVPDRGLVEATERELGEALWIRLGLDDVLRTARGQFAKVEPAQLGAGGPLALACGVDGALTRRAWDEAVEDLVAEKATVLARSLSGIGTRRDAGELRRRLAEAWTAAHRKAWLAALAGARAVPPAAPEDIPARIDAVAGAASPWPVLVKRVAGELDAPTGGIRLPFSTDTAWTATALAAIRPLERDVREWLSAVPAGSRSKDSDRVLALARRFDDAWTTACAALAPVQGEDLRESLRASLAGLVRGLWAPVDAALVAELEVGWRARVVPAWKAECAGRFPFAAAPEEVPLEVFARFANPRTGVLWAGMDPIERLRAQGLAGRPALSVSGAYAAMAGRAREIRAGFFPNDAEKVEAPFVLTLVQREGVADLVFAVGAQSVRFYDRPDARYPLALRQGEPAGARISARVVTGEWKAAECAGSAWGLLRLIASGDPRPTREGGWGLTWDFPGLAAGKAVSWHAQAVLEGPAVGHAATGDLLSGFAVPEGLAPAEGE